MSIDNTFESKHFEEMLQQVEVPGGVETVMEGQKRFDLIGKAFDELSGPVVVMGYASQGPAHANNLRSSLEIAGSDTEVIVALREGSPRRELAENDGFTVENGTLMTPDRALAEAGFVAMLIADGAMAEHGEEFLGKMHKDSVLGLAHGFFPGYLEAQGKTIGDIAPHLGGVVGVCPKGMGPSVRKLYEQGSGINTSFAVESGAPDKMTDLALSWALGIGAPYTFQTTLGKEWRSDIYGERAMLLGGVHGLVEAMYSHKLQNGLSEEVAYTQSVETLVGPISETISKSGLLGVIEKLDERGLDKFKTAYNAAYPVLKPLTAKLYRDVSSGREIQEVVDDYNNESPKPQVDGSAMWNNAKNRPAKTDDEKASIKIDPEVAGVYIAGIMAQVDVLREKGHNWSEVINESIIEAVDSLNPYMAKAGVGFMIDNCSDTAQRGARKWAPVYESWIRQHVLPVLDGREIQESSKPGMLGPVSNDSYSELLNSPVHKAFNTFAKMRPDVSISL